MSTESTLERYIIDEIMIGQDQKTIAPDQSLLDAGILDSLALLRLMGYIEDHYQITIEADEVVPENFETLETMVEFIERKRAS